jgi:superfamily II DNA or RNA helicase
MIVRDYLYVKPHELSKGEWRKLFQKMRYTDANSEVHEPWTFQPLKQRYRLPRGAWAWVPSRVEYDDRRVLPKGRRLEFNLELDATLPDGRTFRRQKDAVKSMLHNEQGIVNRPPGTGKTQIVLAFLAVCETPGLVLVHTEDILQQWIDYAKVVLPDAEIGVIRGNEEHVGDITIATIQTFHNRMQDDHSWRKRFGAVILDEAHHASARTFHEILNRMHAHYRFGVTATLTRADKHHPYMKSILGPVIHKVPFESPIPVKVEYLKSGLRFRWRGAFDWDRLLKAIIKDEKRNKMIAARLDREVRKGKSCLVLSRSIEHLHRIAAESETFENQGAFLTGQIIVGYDDDGNELRERVPKETRKEVAQQFRSGEIKIVYATQLADEALDVPILSCVALTYPGKHDGRIVQQVGRALREHPGKKSALIIDVVDHRVKPTRRHWMQRRKAYKKMKIESKLPAIKKIFRKTVSGDV